MWSDNLIPGTQLIKMNQAKKKKNENGKKSGNLGRNKIFRTSQHEDIILLVVI